MTTPFLKAAPCLRVSGKERHTKWMITLFPFLDAGCARACDSIGKLGWHRFLRSDIEAEFTRLPRRLFQILKGSTFTQRLPEIGARVVVSALRTYNGLGLLRV